MRRLLIASFAAAAVAAGLIPSTALAAGTTTGADIQVSGSSNLGSPVQGQPYTYTYQVKNSGPQDAPSVTFTDDLTAGTVAYAQVLGGTFTTQCTHIGDGTGGTLISCAFPLAKGGQVNISESVNAPTTIGTFANTGTATPTNLTDPNPANNSATVSVKVGSAACSLPAGQPTTTGVVWNKYYDSNGFLSSFTFFGNDGVTYTVLVNLFTAPLTTTINLLCKTVPANLYIQTGNIDNVTGPVDMEILPGGTDPTPVIHALVVQTPYWVDKVA